MNQRLLESGTIQFWIKREMKKNTAKKKKAKEKNGEDKVWTLAQVQGVFLAYAMAIAFALIVLAAELCKANIRKRKLPIKRIKEKYDASNKS